MIVQELIDELSKFGRGLEVIISDGYENNYYHTKGILVHEYKDFETPKCVEIAIGGCKIELEEE